MRGFFFLRDRKRVDGARANDSAVTLAEGGERGIATFESSPRGFDAVITDLGMPHVDGGRVAAAVKRALASAGLPTPVIVAGGLNTFEQAEGILAGGSADIIAAARQSLADPDWWTKMREGRGGEIRRCQLTNYCEALDQRHKAVTCRLWDRERLDEPGVPLDETGRRRLIAPRAPLIR